MMTLTSLFKTGSLPHILLIPVDMPPHRLPLTPMMKLQPLWTISWLHCALGGTKNQSDWRGSWAVACTSLKQSVGSSSTQPWNGVTLSQHVCRDPVCRKSRSLMYAVLPFNTEPLHVSHSVCHCSMSAAEDLKEILKARETELHSETLRADAAEHRCSLLEESLRDGHAQQLPSPVQRAQLPHAMVHGCAGFAWPGSPAPSTAPHTPHVPSTVTYDPAPQHSQMTDTSPHTQASGTRTLATENAQLKEEKNLLCIQLAVRINSSLLVLVCALYRSAPVGRNPQSIDT